MFYNKGLIITAIMLHTWKKEKKKQLKSILIVYRLNFVIKQMKITLLAKINLCRLNGIMLHDYVDKKCHHVISLGVFFLMKNLHMCCNILISPYLFLKIIAHIKFFFLFVKTHANANLVNNFFSHNNNIRKIENIYTLHKR
jgi:hypothetical protein